MENGAAVLEVPDFDDDFRLSATRKEGFDRGRDAGDDSVCNRSQRTIDPPNLDREVPLCGRHIQVLPVYGQRIVANPIVTSLGEWLHRRIRVYVDAVRSKR